MIPSIFLFATFVLIESLEMQDLPKFFSTTFISKENGAQILKTDGEWDLYHLHHVCIDKGTHGLYMGISDGTTEIPERWNSKEGQANMEMLSIVEWRDLTANVLALTEYKPKMMKGFSHSLHAVKNPTFYINCHITENHAENVLDWVMHLGVFFETSLFFKNHPMFRTL